MKEYESGAFRMRIGEDRIKEIMVKKNVTLQAPDLRESLEISLRDFGQSPFFVLLEGEENASVSPEARQIAASEGYARYHAALALCSARPAMSVLGNLFLRFNRPSVPTRFFYDRRQALDWLKIQAGI